MKIADINKVDAHYSMYYELHIFHFYYYYSEPLYVLEIFVQNRRQIKNKI